MRRDRDDSGSVALELAIAAPALLLLLLSMVASSRYTTARQVVEDASREGARAASLARSTGEADSAASAAALADLSSQELHCGGGGARVSVGAPNRTGGTDVGGVAAYDISTTVTCDVTLSDLGLPGLPGTVSVSRTTTEPLDPLRDGAVP